MNDNLERAHAVWKTCDLRQGTHYPDFCDALRKSPWALDLRVVSVPMEVLVSLKEGTVYGCIYADAPDRFIILVRDDLPLDHQDLVVYHEADHAISGDVVPNFPGNLREHMRFSVQWRQDLVVTPQEVGADEFAREIHRLTIFGLSDDEAPAETPQLAEEDVPLPGRVQAFHSWIRRRRWTRP